MSLDLLWNWFPHVWKDGPLQPGWYRPHFARLSIGASSYYLFIEDVARIEDFANVDGPGDAGLGRFAKDFERPQMRFRASAVSALAFTASSEDFGILGRDARPDERAQRRDRLTVFFDENPVERFDIYVDEEDREVRAIGATFVPSSWHLVLFDPDRWGDGARRAFRAPIGAAGEEGYEALWLISILPIAPPVEVQLRDVFSLNHIGDADLEPPEGAGRPGGPPDDDAPDKGESWIVGEVGAMRLPGLEQT